MRRLRIEMQALIDAMAMLEDVPWQSFLDLRDGVIVEVDAESEDVLDDAIEHPEVDLDPERYFEIPRLEAMRNTKSWRPWPRLSTMTS